MDFIRKNSIAILTITIIIVAFFAYKMFSGDKEEVVVEENAIKSEVVRELEHLKSLNNIDGGIFASPAFVGLKGRQAPVVPEAKGRPNPFVSVGR